MCIYFFTNIITNLYYMSNLAFHSLNLHLKHTFFPLSSLSFFYFIFILIFYFVFITTLYNMYVKSFCVINNNLIHRYCWFNSNPFHFLLCHLTNNGHIVFNFIQIFLVLLFFVSHFVLCDSLAVKKK